MSSTPDFRPTSKLTLAAVLTAAVVSLQGAEPPQKLTLAREGHWLVIQGQHLPGGEIRINYLEAYCRAGSTDADWVAHTVIRHTNELVSLSTDRRELRLKDTLADGLIVEHVITAKDDEIHFELLARNPTNRRSAAHWAQPCVRLGQFTGFAADHAQGDINDYLSKCFVFLRGGDETVGASPDRSSIAPRLVRLPTWDWATTARYVPGQVWAAPGVPRTDVNPRPLNSRTPAIGLIGCFSGDNSLIFATAWEPYQELFQGVARCLHSDFRLGGIGAGESRRIKGKIYIVPNDVQALLARYRRDFGASLDSPGSAPTLPR